MKISIFLTIYICFSRYGKLSGYDYDISVWTADKPNADTDAYVYIIIYGMEGALPETKLDAGFFWNDRERGRRDDMTHSYSKYVGKLYKIRLRITGNDDWLVKKIKVTDKRNGCQYMFYYNSWLGGAYTDRMTSVYERKPAPFETTCSGKLFKRKGKGSILLGHSLGQNYTDQTCPYNKCAHLCTQQPRCTAFNMFKVSGTSANCICELKAVTIPVGTTSLTQSPSNSYYELIEYTGAGTNSDC